MVDGISAEEIYESAAAGVAVHGPSRQELLGRDALIADVLAWLAAESLRLTMSTQVAMRVIDQHPGLAMLHPESNAREWVTMVHWDNMAARSNRLRCSSSGCSRIARTSRVASSISPT